MLYEELEARSFIKQMSQPEKVRDRLNGDRMVFYVGFDPTADSLHVGSLVPIMGMARLQKAGHIPIAIIGGGTALIGDPSGKTEMRKMLTAEEIESNGRRILAQLQRYLTLDGTSGMFINNADWLASLNYLEFLRDIGRHFRVNDMIRNEGYRLRLEREEGLSFIEFNYQLLQAYDFLVLHDQHQCVLQMGGDDQWGNILAGVELVRRMRSHEVLAMTFPLLTTASGQKMGKTEKGAIWLDPDKTSPYDFYQYWVNTDDRDVKRFMQFFTFLSLEEIIELCSGTGAELNAAKRRLAFEATKITHGEEAAASAEAASAAVFGGQAGDLSDLPTTKVGAVELQEMTMPQLMVRMGVASSNGEANRLIKQGGVTCEGSPVSSAAVKPAELMGGKTEALFRRGKKQFYRLLIR